MAYNIHTEARRRQSFLDRVCKARREAGLCNDEGQQVCRCFCPPHAIDMPAVSGGGASGQDQVMCPDQGTFYQTRSIHVWTGPERNRRAYDRSREGPVLGQSWRALEREMNFRENSLSANLYQSRMPSLGFMPVDASLRK